MKELTFYKVQASGNDFILVDLLKLKKLPSTFYWSKFAKKYCPRKTEIGADGVLVIEPGKTKSFRMRIFNPDGKEAQMCGNGARCAAFWYIKQNSRFKIKNSSKIEFETKAGVIGAKVDLYGKVKIKMSKPFDMKLQLPIKVLDRNIHVNFLNTGVPHTIVFVESVDNTDVEKIGAAIRYHQQFAPQGTNVNFVEYIKEGWIKIRTYERGVEAETLACGTGSVACAILSDLKFNPDVKEDARKVKVSVQGGEDLIVSFSREGEYLSDVWLEGKASLVYKGVVIYD